jgi:transposase
MPLCFHVAIKPLKVTDAETMVLALQDEIRRSEESRYDHRLHGVLLVAHGISCREAAGVLGDAPRTVENWIHRFEKEGLAGLTEGERPGRPSGLSPAQMAKVETSLRQTPTEAGVKGGGVWDGKTLSCYLEQKFGVELQARQCQRLFRQLGFRLRKPRPWIAPADPQAQATHKKTPRTGKKSRH